MHVPVLCFNCGGYFGFSTCFSGGFVGLGCFWGRFRCLTGASTVFWDLGFTWVLGAEGDFWPGGFDKLFCCFWALSL